MRQYACLSLLLAAVLTGCVPLGQQEALHAQLVKEWQRIPSWDDMRGQWGGERLKTDQGLLITCKTPGVLERSISQNGINDGVSYRQCPPLVPQGPSATQPWPAPLSGQRLAPRS